VPGDDGAPKPPTGPRESLVGSGEAACQVELFGLARSIVGQRDLAVELPREATVADALARLAASYPELVGRVIRPDGQGLTEGQVLNLNGRTFVEDVGAAVGPGDTLLILSNTAGG
jgi:molybdopterin converting factor small subunit